MHPEIERHEDLRIICRQQNINVHEQACAQTLTGDNLDPMHECKGRLLLEVLKFIS